MDLEILASHLEVLLYPASGIVVPLPYLIGMRFLQIRMDFPFSEAEKTAFAGHSAVVLGVYPDMPLCDLCTILLFSEIVSSRSLG
jgi:hypothetical protein